MIVPFVPTRTFAVVLLAREFRCALGRAEYHSRLLRLTARLAVLLIAIAVAAAATPSATAAEAPKGKLVIVGGGGTPPGLFSKMLGLGGGAEARVLVVPLASAINDGQAARSAFVAAGAKTVAVLGADDPAKALGAVRNADVIWFGGGSQSALMVALGKLGVIDAIRERYRGGAIIGGTSAGAAVMSKLMIAGSPRDGGEFPLLGEGLGLWPETVVDQHFAQRSREPRLRAVVLKHPALPGIGIDERTYVLVAGDELEVGGSGNVTVLDARWSPEPQRFQMHPGDRWHFLTERK